jgi:hypothetical protein
MNHKEPYLLTTNSRSKHKGLGNTCFYYSNYHILYKLNGAKID